MSHLIRWIVPLSLAVVYKSVQDISVRQSVLADAMNISHGTSSAGNPAQTPLQAFIASEAVSDSFGSATFLTELSLEHAVGVGAVRGR